MKGCVEVEEKRNGDNKKSNLGSQAVTNPFQVRIRQISSIHSFKHGFIKSSS